MRLDLRALKLRGGDRYESSFMLDVAPLVLGGASYDVLLPEGARVMVDRTGGGYVFRVSAHAKVYGPCARCLRDAVVEVRADQEEFAATVAGGWEESELSDYVADMIVDIDGIVREAVVLALPDQILCSATCKGLCPRCGHDLNEGPCGCDALEISDSMG